MDEWVIPKVKRQRHFSDTFRSSSCHANSPSTCLFLLLPSLAAFFSFFLSPRLSVSTPFSLAMRAPFLCCLFSRFFLFLVLVPFLPVLFYFIAHDLFFFLFWTRTSDTGRGFLFFKLRSLSAFLVATYA